MRTKKAQVFELFIVIAFLFVGGYILYLAIKGNIDFNLNMQTPTVILEMYNDADRFMLFAKESGKLAIMQAYYDSIYPIPLYVGRECEYDKLKTEYIELCSISPDVEKNFVSKINENFQKYMLQYKEKFSELDYSLSMENDIITFHSSQISSRVPVEKGFFPFAASYKFDPSFSISLNELGLDNLRKVAEVSKDCFKKRNELDVIDCIKQLNNFDPAARSEDNKRFFDLKTKKRFFYIKDSQSVYENIIIRFFMKE